MWAGYSSPASTICEQTASIRVQPPNVRPEVTVFELRPA